MLGHSHALSGAVAGAAAGIVLHLPDPRLAALAGFTAGMALLPDLDKCRSARARCLGFMSEAIVPKYRAVLHRLRLHLQWPLVAVWCLPNW